MVPRYLTNLAALGGLAALAGCAAPTIAVPGPQKNYAQFQQDDAACRPAGIPAEAVNDPNNAAHTAYLQCMTARGNQVMTVPSGYAYGYGYGYPYGPYPYYGYPYYWGAGPWAYGPGVYVDIGRGPFFGPGPRFGGGPGPGFRGEPGFGGGPGGGGFRGGPGGGGPGGGRP